MAFEQSITLPSQHQISYWRITDADIDFIGETAKFKFGGYIDRQNRLQFENQPAKTHFLTIPSPVFNQNIPDYDTALPSKITTDILLSAGGPFEGGTALSNMTWNYNTTHNGFPVSHFRIRRLRMNWNNDFAMLSINAYKDEATFDPENPNENRTPVGGDLQSYRFSRTEFQDYFRASLVGGSQTFNDSIGGGGTVTVVDPLEGELGFNRETVYTYAKNYDPFFANATDITEEQTSSDSVNVPF